MKKTTRCLAGLFFMDLLSDCANSSTQSTPASTQQELTKEHNKLNTFYPSESTQKEQFYLNSNPVASFSPFEVTFDQNYKKLTCTLYQLQEESWVNLEQFDLELSGEEFWFLVNTDLTNAQIHYKNVNPVSSNHRIIGEGGRPFEKAVPDFGEEGTLQHFSFTKPIDVKNGQEFPVMAFRIWKDMDRSLEASTDDFVHPEKIDLKGNEAYYMLTFTFNV